MKNQVNFCLKTWLNHCWCGENYDKLCLSLQKNIKKVKLYDTVNLHRFRLKQSYKILFNLSNVGNIFWGWTPKDHNWLKKKTKGIFVLCSPTP